MRSTLTEAVALQCFDNINSDNRFIIIVAVLGYWLLLLWPFSPYPRKIDFSGAILVPVCANFEKVIHEF